MKAVCTAAFAQGLVLKEYFPKHINLVTKGVSIYVANIANQGGPRPRPWPTSPAIKRPPNMGR